MDRNRTVFVGEKDPKEREEIIAFLQKEGFTLDKNEIRDHEQIIASFLPIIVNKEEKTYRMMGNVTCAAAAGGSGLIMTEEAFYMEFDN